MFERDRQGAVDLVRGNAPLKIDTLEELQKILAAIAGHGQPRLVLDLGQVPLVDSAGLELLLNFHEAFARRGGALKLASDFRRMMAGDLEPDEDEFGDLLALKGVVKYPIRIKCAVLAWDVLQEALTGPDGEASGAASHSVGA